MPDPASKPDADQSGLLQIDILRENGDWGTLDDVEGLIRAAVEAAFQPAPDSAADQVIEVSILLENDAALQALNKQWRNKDKPTNVLSFPAPPLPDATLAMQAARHLGDIALSFDTLAAEARTENKTVSDHLQHLVVHGMLHLQGHDHQTPGDADEMEDLERRILADLGIGDPYAS
ncbi:Metal-dependent hydrolase YbeY, involved in rRNA and/or ribosome maturation and assembly [Candidatus Phaeomarinobacter ectocarpi]|uniref:Endoribonuclease YbeY n=1 Tax=Candidatus Phaeomarinibacter ectocarpi TaxID=1458461 RepID=X5MLW0_9HYPH|nr:rRNA maturation RNase YbeY [Candidatus Phaeomarinobacter ectocarpi]CDO59845.1 Metal-dependent hydrolase YbeY, involved in rRNA and/or ribosome maturation and assembly [Candidatus Phaeomarinobacter ectocarpi]